MGELSGEEGREEGEGLLGNRCQCDCYGNWPSWGGAGRGRGALGPLSASSRPRPRGGGGGGNWAPSGSGGCRVAEPDAAETLLHPLLFHGVLVCSSPLGVERREAIPSRPPTGAASPPWWPLGKEAAGNLLRELECAGATRGPGTAWKGRGRRVRSGGAGRRDPQVR